MSEVFSNTEIKKAKKVLESHVIKHFTRESALESLIFCIASQALNWEKVSDFIYKIREHGITQEGYAHMDALTDSKLLENAAYQVGHRFWNQKRFDSAIDYFNAHPGLNWIKTVKYLEPEDRKKWIKKIKWVKEKTFSFWHLCLGGRKLMTQDVHVLNAANDVLGIEIDQEYRKPIEQSKQKEITCEFFGEIENYETSVTEKTVRKTLSNTKYNSIEEKIFEYFQNDQRFHYRNKLDAALITSTLWWRGAGRGEPMDDGFIESICSYLPYSGEHLKTV